MSSTFQSKPEMDDAFSEMPDFASQVPKTLSRSTQTGSHLKKSAQSEAEGAKPETGTKVYIGKKITDSTSYKKGSQVKETTFVDFSIDTSYPNDKPVNKNTTIADISINDDISPQIELDVEPIIIDEELPASPQTVTAGPSREKFTPNQLSLDISNTFLRTEIPSGSEKIPLGSGVITGVLGSGGMARVYRIWNEKLEVYRAVKILLSMNQQTTRTRFETEAKISAKLHHPNIVEIHTVGEWRGIPYLEMEIVEGETLSALIAKHKNLPAPVCAAICLQVARALAYAHSQEILIYGNSYKGIIHRDLKPSNIMIGNNGVVKLMDFGVARPVETGFHTVDTESIVGTIHYFSPEQIAGYPIDTLSDIYSFGAMLYEMLCGQNPFPQTSMLNLIRAKEKNSFSRLEDYPLYIDARMASVAQTCLRTDKNARFQSAELLRDHLERILNSFDMGESEKLIGHFLKDPQSIVDKSEHMARFSDPQNETSQLTDVKPILEAAVSSSIDKDESDISEPQKSEKKRVPVMLITATVLIVMIIAGLILFFVRNAQHASCTTYKSQTIAKLHSIPLRFNEGDSTV